MKHILAAMIAVAVVAPLLTSNAEAKPLRCMERFTVKEFVIGAWWGPDPSEANYRAYKDAGFNVLMNYRNRANPKNGEDYQVPDEEVRLAEKLGLWLMLDTYMRNDTPWGGIEADPPVSHPNHHSARPAQLAWLLARYGKSPRLAGILLGDNCGLHGFMAENARSMAETNPGLWPWLSTNPDVLSQANEPMPLLTTQNYPFLYQIGEPEPVKREAFCSRLEADRRNANALNMALWPFNNCSGGVSPSQIRFQVYAQAAYGSQAIWYFHYNDGVWDPLDEKPGPLYEAAKEANWYLRGVGDKLVGRRCLGAYHTPGPNLAQGAIIPAEGKLIERMSDGLLAGLLALEDRYFTGVPDLVLVVDKRTVTPNEEEPGPREVTVKFSPDVTSVTVYGTSGPEKVKLPGSRRLDLTLKAGEGVLIGLG